MKVQDSDTEKHKCRCRRYTWTNGSGCVVSRKLTDYECQLEDDVEKLQDALFTISSHYAKIQFRLRQIANASDCERICLLRELERIIFQGIDENRENTECPILIKECQSSGSVRIKQRQIISELRSRIADLTDDAGSCYYLDSESNSCSYHQIQQEQEMSHEPNCPCIVCQEARLEQKCKDRGYLSEEEEKDAETFCKKRKSKTKKKRKISPIRNRKNSASRRNSSKKRKTPNLEKQPIIGCTRLSYSELIARHQGTKKQIKNSGSPKASPNNESRSVSAQSSRVKFSDTPNGSKKEKNLNGKGGVRKANHDKKQREEKSNSRAPESQQSDTRNYTIEFPCKEDECTRENTRSQEFKQTSAQSSNMQLSKKDSSYRHKELPLQPCNSQCSQNSGTAQEIPCPRRCVQYQNEIIPNELEWNTAQYTASPVQLPSNSQSWQNSGTAQEIPCPPRQVQYQKEIVPNEAEWNSAQYTASTVQLPSPKYNHPVIKAASLCASLCDDEQRPREICQQHLCRGNCVKRNTRVEPFSGENQIQQHKWEKKVVKKQLKFCEKESCPQFQTQSNEQEMTKPKNDHKIDYKNYFKKEKFKLKSVLKNSRPLYPAIPQPNNYIDTSRTSCLVYPNKYGQQNITQNDRRFCRLFSSRPRKDFEKQKPNKEDLGSTRSNEEQRKDYGDTDC